MTSAMAATIKTRRGDRSGQWLADRCKALGHPISRTALWEIENGKRRTIAVAELLVIAAALDVPPVQLVFPDLPDGPAEALPDMRMSSLDAVRWITGEGDLPDPSMPEVDTAMYKRPPSPYRLEWHPNTELLSLCREYADLCQRTSERMAELMPGTSDTPADWQAQMERVTDEHNRRRIVLEQAIVRAGGTLDRGER